MIFWICVLFIAIIFVVLFAKTFLIESEDKKIEEKEESEIVEIIIPNPVSRKYFKLTEDAGVLYRSGKYSESLDCCYQIIEDIDDLKKEFVDIKNYNKDFIPYTLMNLCKLGVTEVGDKTFRGICDSDIITEEQLKDEIKEHVDLEIGNQMNTETLKKVIHYFGERQMLSESEASSFIKEIDETIERQKKHFADKNKIKKVVLEKLQSGKIKQKEIYKLLPEFDGRYVLPFIKELDKDGVLSREKEGNEYYISLK